MPRSAAPPTIAAGGMIAVRVRVWAPIISVGAIESSFVARRVGSPVLVSAIAGVPGGGIIVSCSRRSVVANS
jgi:hypothetical protein